MRPPSSTATATPVAVDDREPNLPDHLAAAISGDVAAFTALYRETQPRLLRYAASLVGQDAEDVTAEAWLQIARDLPRFDGDMAGFRAWTVTIVRNRAFDHLRSMQRRPTVALEDFLLDRPTEPDAASVAGENLSTAAALDLIYRLPPDQAEAVLLRVVIGVDAPTAAKILGKRPGAVRVAAHRGLRTLARLIEPVDSGPDADACNGPTGDGA